MLVEIHALQNFAPSNLNRDDTGSPKDCMFGDYRRARISSQALKRAIRTSFEKEKLFTAEGLSRRTKRLVGELADRLVQGGRSAEDAPAVAWAALAAARIGPEEKDPSKTEYPVFLGEREIAAIAALCSEHWDDLAAPAREMADIKGTGREAKDKRQSKVPADARKALLGAFNGGKAAGLALFGRMLADMPGKNVDAACQVAHAISTNRMSVEFDYFTAVDDLNPAEETGAGMIGTVEFNSACFYRYANVDLDVLTENLQGDSELARASLEAFLRAFVSAVPSGKQHSMAAQNPPSFVLAVARRSGLWSLANAFLQPVRPDERRDLAQASVGRLDAYWGQLAGMYGETDIQKWCASLDGEGLDCLAGNRQPSVEALVNQTVAAAASPGAQA